jgi:hypothetical protein
LSSAEQARRSQKLGQKVKVETTTRTGRFSSFDRRGVHGPARVRERQRASLANTGASDERRGSDRSAVSADNGASGHGTFSSRSGGRVASAVAVCVLQSRTANRVANPVAATPMTDSQRSNPSPRLAALAIPKRGSHSLAVAPNRATPPTGRRRCAAPLHRRLPAASPRSRP